MVHFDRGGLFFYFNSIVIHLRIFFYDKLECYLINIKKSTIISF